MNPEHFKKRLFDDCTKCQAVILIWNKHIKRESDIKWLERNVPKVFDLKRCKWDKAKQTLTYTLACRECGNTVTVPAV